MSDFRDIFMEEADRRGIWLPPSASSIQDRKLDEMEPVVGKIRNAVYHIDEGKIALTVVLPDGTERVTYWGKELFTFGGRSHAEAPRDESDREMAKTAGMLREAQGKPIKLMMYRHQLEK